MISVKDVARAAGVAGALVLLAAGSASGAMPPAYTVTDLGTFGGTRSDATAINDSGQIVGGAMNASGHWRAFIWQAGNMEDLGTFGGWDSKAYDINSSGWVVGYAELPSGESRPFLWRGGTIENLGTLAYGSLANGINDQGQVVGLCAMGGTSNPCHPWIWDSGSMTDLGTLGGDSGGAEAINNGGKIVGWSQTVDGTTWATYWENGKPTSLGSTSPATDVNSGGQVSILPLWGINDQGQAVGCEYTVPYAFLEQGGQRYNLNDYLLPGTGWHLMSAGAINNLGQIVGQGTNPQGYDHAFLLTPIPEPAALSLLALGGLVALRRRR